MGNRENSGCSNRDSGEWMIGIVLILFTAVFLVLLLVMFGSRPAHAVLSKSSSLDPTPIGGNCGPEVLQRILAAAGHRVEIDSLTEQTRTEHGMTSLEGMREGVGRHNFQAVGVKTDVDGLARLLAANHRMIAHVGGNRHYVWIQTVTDRWVTGYNPAAVLNPWRIPRAVFEKMWSGEGLMVSDSAAILPDTTMRLVYLTPERMREIRGGECCANVNGTGGNNGSTVSASEPVDITNGNLFEQTVDFDIPSLGPDLRLVRRYNAQIFSDIDGWQPEGGTGGWSVIEGRYAGSGDRTGTTDTSYENLDLTLTMQTVIPGAERDFEVAWVNFRFVNEQNRYYFMIKKTGDLELTRYKDGQAGFLVQRASGYSPNVAHTVRIRADGNHLQLWIDGIPEIDLLDTDVLQAGGKVVLESYFSHSRYDDIQIMLK